MRNVLFQNQQALTESQLAEHVRAIGVKGTPGFVVGRTQAGDTVEGMPIRGGAAAGDVPPDHRAAARGACRPTCPQALNSSRDAERGGFVGGVP